MFVLPPAEEGLPRWSGGHRGPLCDRCLSGQREKDGHVRRLPAGLLRWRKRGVSVRLQGNSSQCTSLGELVFYSHHWLPRRGLAAEMYLFIILKMQNFQKGVISLGFSFSKTRKSHNPSFIIPIKQFLQLQMLIN